MLDPSLEKNEKICPSELEKRIEDDLIEALKKKEADKLSVLRMLKAAIKNTAKEKREEVLGDSEVVGILKRQVKQRRESIEAFSKGNREDLAEKEKWEMEVLLSYMPPELSEEEIVKVVLKAIEETAASGKQDTGKVMKSVMLELKGKADGKLVSKIVTEKLIEREQKRDDNNESVEKN